MLKLPKPNKQDYPDYPVFVVNINIMIFVLELKLPKGKNSQVVIWL